MEFWILHKKIHFYTIQILFLSINKYISNLFVFQLLTNLACLLSGKNPSNKRFDDVITVYENGFIKQLWISKEGNTRVPLSFVQCS